MGKPGKEKMIDFYRQMLRIRRAEEKLMEVFSAGEILGFLHVSIGQEAAPVGVCAHLRDDDYIGTTHRGHGYAIAKGIELKNVKVTPKSGAPYLLENAEVEGLPK